MASDYEEIFSDRFEIEAKEGSGGKSEGYEYQDGCEERKKWCAMQHFRSCINAKIALMFLCMAAFLQGLVTNGFYNIVVSTLEKRFMLRSSETGLISSSYDIAGCLSLLLITYLGGRGHKPVWIGLGVLLIGFGSILFSLPHFLAPAYSIPQFDLSACDNYTLYNCEEPVRVYRVIFILSQLLTGIGATPLFTLSLTYLDENVPQIQSSVFHGIFFAFSLFGPGIGYLFGGYLLTYFTNPNETLDITQESPMWIGNWWVGFLSVGVIQILIAFPIMAFPQRLSGASEYGIDREKEVHHVVGSERFIQEEFGKSIRDLPRCLLLLLKNPAMIFISLAGAMDSGMTISLGTFGPKYIQSVFNLSAAGAAFFFGVMAIVTASSAHVISGLIISKLKLSVPQMLRMCIVSGVLAFCCFFVFLQNCKNTDIAGVTVPYPGEVVADCSLSMCGCSTATFSPVCGNNNLTYISHCDAGCKHFNDSVFKNCSRIPSPGTAYKGACTNSSCDNFGVFLAFIGVAVFFTFFKGQPALQSTMRSVPFYQRSFALGIQWLIIRSLGSVPMPIIYGKILDLSCLVWEEKCGECGSCQLYNNRTISQSITVITTILKGASCLFVIVMLCCYKPSSLEDQEELVPKESQTQNLSPNDTSSQKTLTVCENATFFE